MFRGLPGNASSNANVQPMADRIGANTDLKRVRTIQDLLPRKSYLA
jgi:hypothetical protein